MTILGTLIPLLLASKLFSTEETFCDYVLPPPLFETSSCSSVTGHVEFLYLKPFFDNTSAGKTLIIQGATPESIGPTTAFQGSTAEAFVVPITSDYHSGFKIALGAEFPCQPFSSELSWTHYFAHQENDTIFYPFVDEVFAFGMVDFSLSSLERGFAGDVLVEQTHSWNTLDLSFSYPFWVGKSVLFEPKVAVSVLLLEQKFGIKTDIVGLNAMPGGSLTNSDFRNRFRGAGITGSLETSWKWFSSLSLYGKIGGGTYFGKSNASHKFISDVVTEGGREKFSITELADFSIYRNEIIFEADIAAGFEWIQLFNCNEDGLRVRLGWQWTNYFSVLQYPKIKYFLDLAALSGTLPMPLWTNPSISDLSFGGLTLSLEIKY